MEMRKLTKSIVYFFVKDNILNQQVCAQEHWWYDNKTTTTYTMFNILYTDFVSSEEFIHSLKIDSVLSENLSLGSIHFDKFNYIWDETLL